MASARRAEYFYIMKILNKTLVLAGLPALALALAFSTAQCGGNDGSSNQSFNPVVSGSSCAQDKDCDTGQVCGFAIADKCGAKGVCLIYPTPGTAHCNSVRLACGCSGNQVAVACDFPDGYATEPVSSESAVNCM